MLNDPLANALSNIINHERIGKNECTISPMSKPIREVLNVFNRAGYIGQIEELTKEKGGVYRVNLLGSINKCAVIKPRLSFKYGELVKFEKRFLPAEGMGMLIVTTPKGIMTNIEAKKAKTGGRLLAYCY